MMRVFLIVIIVYVNQVALQIEEKTTEILRQYFQLVNRRETLQKYVAQG